MLIKALVGFVFALMVSGQSYATVTLLDQNDWKFLFGGFVESDFFYDSTRSFTEVVGNTPIVRSGTTNGLGDNGRSQFSIRNSRFAFTALPPVKNDFRTKGYLEFDLLGYDPTPSGTGTTNSESAFFTNPTLRVRHAYLSAEREGYLLLVGQTWTLFGWQPTYVLTTASVPPVSGTTYERTPQIFGLKNIQLSTSSKLQAGVSLERPAQRDSDAPNLDGGLKFIWAGRSAGFASPSSDVTAEPLSLGVSGTFRQFITATPGGGVGDTTRTFGGALAVNTLIPVIASPDGKEVKNTLTLTGELTAGSGYGDEFPSFTGNIPQLTASSSAPTSTTSLDGGQGGFDSSGNFQLAKLQTWNVQAQYHLPTTESSTFVTAGYGQLMALNVTTFTPTSGVLYDRSDVAFANLFHDFSDQLRAALEFDRFSTHYVDGVLTYDNRVQISAWFRF